MENEVDSSRNELYRLINGFMITQALHAFTVLGLADLIGTGRRGAGDLATATGTNPAALYRLLAALAAVGILDEDGDQAFALTQLGDGLRADATQSAAGWVALVGRPSFWQNWGQLADSVRTGETGWRLRHGVDVWTYREQHPDESTAFDRAMVSLTAGEAEAVTAAYDFGRFASIVDVGGGRGALLGSILVHNPGAMGVLLDQAHVVDKAAELLRSMGVEERCQVVSGSFFESVPEGGDVYILKSIIHDWYDPEARLILQACRRAMADDALLLVVERVLAPPNQGPATKLGDLNMLVGPGGMERSREHFAELLGGAGFRLDAVVPTKGLYHVLEARPA